MDAINGSRSFTENVKMLLGFKAKGRKLIESDEGYEVREAAGHSKALVRGGKDDIAAENVFFWDISTE
jgi:hypothetical protein